MESTKSNNSRSLQNKYFIQIKVVCCHMVADDKIMDIYVLEDNANLMSDFYN